MTQFECTIYLNTPLAETGSAFSGYDRVRGKGLSHEAGGVLVQVKALGTSKDWQDKTLPVKKIFIPYHKIDFIDLS